jgi:DNA-binding transcriptional ArsR family regulator
MEDDPEYRRTYIRSLSKTRVITPFGRALAFSDPKAQALALRALGTYQKSAIDGWMPQIQAQVATEHRGLAQVAAEGTGRLLESLHPLISWKAPVLSVFSGLDVDVHLEGRGLLIQPTVFAGGRPWISGFDTKDYQLTLFVPPRRQLPLGEHEPESPRNTAALLGRTRSALLETIVDSGPHTTGELARRAGCSPASVSDHTSVLRASGLITTIRVGQFAHHAATELGEALVSAARHTVWP